MKINYEKLMYYMEILHYAHKTSIEDLSDEEYVILIKYIFINNPSVRSFKKSIENLFILAKYKFMDHREYQQYKENIEQERTEKFNRDMQILRGAFV